MNKTQKPCNELCCKDKCKHLHQKEARLCDKCFQCGPCGTVEYMFQNGRHTVLYLCEDCARDLVYWVFNMEE